MHIYRRGRGVPVKWTWYNSSGEAVSPSSARCWVSYLSTAVCNDGTGVLDQGRASTHFLLTETTATKEWSGTWSSTAAQPGHVYYHIKPASSTLQSVDGVFELRGNPANLVST